MLRGGDLCVCQMTAVLELAASTVSSHLSDLRRAGLVTERKSGKWVHYHLVDAGPLADLAAQALRLVDDGRPACGRTCRSCARIRKIPLETFCSTGFDRSAAGGRVCAPTPRRPRADRPPGGTHEPAHTQALAEGCRFSIATSRCGSSSRWRSAWAAATSFPASCRSSTGSASGRRRSRSPSGSS